VNVDFLTAASSSIAPGYIADVGSTYGLKRNGFTYGWDQSNENNAADRNSALAPDDRYDTVNYLAPSGRWAIAVPNGRYSVRVVAGNALASDAILRIDVEGVRAIQSTASPSQRWFDRRVAVQVNDGTLAITSAEGGFKNTLAFAEIARVPDNAPEPAVDWSNNTAAGQHIMRVEAGVAQVGSRLFSFGGFVASDELEYTRSGEMLDFKTGAWTFRAPLPGGAAPTHAAVATDGRFIYWVAGQMGAEFGVDATATNTSWRYDIEKNFWEHYVDLPEARVGGALAFYNGNLYFLGGDDAGGRNAVTDHWVINTRSRNPSWQRRAPMPVGGDHLGRAVIDGKIYAIGGETDQGFSYTQHAYLFVYDPLLDVWTRLKDLPTPSSHFESATHVVGTKIVVIAGRIDFPDEFTNEVRVYDVLTNDWTVCAPLPERRLGTTSGIYLGNIYLTGGYSPDIGYSSKSYLADLSGF
jgi:hypothetical protein